MPYHIKKTSNGEIVETFRALPKRVVWPTGEATHGAAAGHVHGDYVLEAYTPEPEVRAPRPADVNSERDRRMQTFAWNGKLFDFGRDDIINIQGVGTLSLAAIVNGAQPGDLRWSSPDADFTWIAADNTQMPMDAHQAFDFAKTAAAWREAHIRAARAIKDTAPIPLDYGDNKYWPQ